MLSVPDHIRQMLGMLEHRSLSSSSSMGDAPVDMDPLDCLYVYYDVIEPQVVGDTLTPLLRIVPMEGKHGRSCHLDL